LPALLLFNNLLADPVACTAVVLFKFAYLIRLYGNMKENSFLRRKVLHTT
jgi:hypothetical protein